MSEEDLVILYNHEGRHVVTWVVKLLTNVCTSTSTVLLAEEAVRGILKNQPTNAVGPSMRLYQHAAYAKKRKQMCHHHEQGYTVYLLMKHWSP